MKCWRKMTHIMRNAYPLLQMVTIVFLNIYIKALKHILLYLESAALPPKKTCLFSNCLHRAKQEQQANKMSKINISISN